MMIHMGNGDLKTLGFFSLFKNRRFVLEIIGNEKIHKLELKAKKGYVGYIFTHEGTHITFKVLMKGEVLESITVDLEKEKSVSFKNRFFMGCIMLKRFKASTFAELENRFLRAKNQREVDFFSVNIEKKSGNAIRELYNGLVYSVDVQKDLAKLLPREVDPEILPYGWEEKHMGNNKRFYVDHNSRVTQWSSPNVEKKNFGEALEKIVEAFDNINIFSPFRSSIVIEVKRNFAIESSYAKLVESFHMLRNVEVKIKFENEIGGDGGGLLREYFDLVSTELLVDKRLEPEKDIYDVASFDLEASPCHDQNFYQKEENKHRNQADNKKFLFYIGMVIALSIRSSSPLKIAFSLCFYENLLKRDYALRKVQDVEYQASLLKIYRNEEDFSGALGVDLSTKKKRERYISEVLYQRYFTSKQKHYEIVKQGFYSVAPDKLSEICSSYALSALVTGPRRVDMSALRASIIYVNCSSFTREVEFLWAILEKRRPLDVPKFLRFCTGSSTVPTNLLLNNRFKLTIEQQNSKNMLFRSSTCISRLWIGIYDTIEDMERLFKTSINETEGFHVV